MDFSTVDIPAQNGLPTTSVLLVPLIQLQTPFDCCSTLGFPVGFVVLWIRVSLDSSASLNVLRLSWDIGGGGGGGGLAISMALVLLLSKVAGATWDFGISWWISRLPRTRIKGAPAGVNRTFNVLGGTGDIWASIVDSRAPVSQQCLEKRVLLVAQCSGAVLRHCQAPIVSKAGICRVSCVGFSWSLGQVPNQTSDMWNDLNGCVLTGDNTIHASIWIADLLQIARVYTMDAEIGVCYIVAGWSVAVNWSLSIAQLQVPNSLVDFVELAIKRGASWLGNEILLLLLVSFLSTV